MPFDDDDLEDYENMSGEEFHEDNLDDEEYEKLYALLPKLKLDLATYNDEVPEEFLKEALYYNYYSIEEALNGIKEKIPKKKGMYNHFNVLCGQRGSQRRATFLGSLRCFITLPLFIITPSVS